MWRARPWAQGVARKGSICNGQKMRKAPQEGIAGKAPAPDGHHINWCRMVNVRNRSSERRSDESSSEDSRTDRIRGYNDVPDKIERDAAPPQKRGREPSPSPLRREESARGRSRTRQPRTAGRTRSDAIGSQRCKWCEKGQCWT